MTTIAVIWYLLKKFGGRIGLWLENVLSQWAKGGFEKAAEENAVLREDPYSPRAAAILAERENEKFIAENLLP